MALVNIHIHADHDKEAIAAILQKLNLALQNQHTMATDFAQLKADFDQLNNTITVERQQILDKLAAAEEKAATLEADLAAAGTDEERTALHEAMQATIQNVKDIIPDTPPA